MKLFVLLSAVCLSATLSATGQVATTTTQPDSTTDAHQRAVAILDKSIETYRKSPAMTDTLEVNINFPAFTKQSMTFDIAMDDKGGASIQSSSVSIVALDKSVYVHDVKLPSKYVQIEVTNDLKTALEKIRIGVPFHFIMRGDARPDFDGLIQSLNAGGASGFTVKQVKNTTTENGQARSTIDLTSLAGTMQVQVDPATNFIRTIYMVQGSEGNNDYGTVIMTLDPKMHESLPKAIAFETAGKKRVASMLELALGVGDMAPDFTLPSSTNETVTLSALRGNVVVLDFWATWCQPCIMGLPKLQEFHQWSLNSGQPIKVFAVNVWERHATEPERKSAALGFWQSRNFSMPTLLDLDRGVAEKYGFQSIPTTVIVAPDGTIAAMHNGFSQNMVELLRKDVEEALQSSVAGQQSAR